MLKVKVDELEERLATPRNAPVASEENIEELESRVVLDAKVIAHLTTLL